MRRLSIMLVLLLGLGLINQAIAIAQGLESINTVGSAPYSSFNVGSIPYSLFNVGASSTVGYSQYIPITITENNTASYNMYPATTLLDNAYLASQGYIVSVLNTSIGALPWMVSSGRVAYALPISQGGSYTEQFILNKVSSVASTDVSVGFGGFLTLANSLALQPGNNFAFAGQGWINTSAGASKYMVNKASAITIDAGSTTAGKITATILSAPNVVAAATVSIGAHTWKVYADGADLKIDIDNVNVASTGLGGHSVPVNTNVYLIDQNNVMPYMSVYTQVVNSTELVRYQPTTLVGDVSYSTGNISGTSGSSILTGGGTTWTDAMTYDLLLINGDSTYYTVTRVVNATTLTVSPALGTSPSTTTYNLYSAVPNNDATAANYALITWGTNAGDITTSAGPLVNLANTPAVTATSPPAIIKGVTGSAGPETVPINSNFPLYGIFAMGASLLQIPTVVLINIAVIFLFTAFGAVCLVARVGPFFTGIFMIIVYVVLNVLHIADYWQVFMVVAFIILSWLFPRQTQVL